MEDGKALMPEKTSLYATIGIRNPFQRRLRRKKVCVTFITKLFGGLDPVVLLP
jgi:hypothetical protein